MITVFPDSSHWTGLQRVSNKPVLSRAWRNGWFCHHHRDLRLSPLQKRAEHSLHGLMLYQVHIMILE